MGKDRIPAIKDLATLRREISLSGGRKDLLPRRHAALEERYVCTYVNDYKIYKFLFECILLLVSKAEKVSST